MLYRNAKTGAIIETESVLGGNWKPVEVKKETAKEPKKKVKK